VHRSCHLRTPLTVKDVQTAPLLYLKVLPIYKSIQVHHPDSERAWARHLCHVGTGRR